MEEVGHRRQEKKQGYDPEQSPSDFYPIPRGSVGKAPTLSWPEEKG